jgi:hypothetical protein
MALRKSMSWACLTNKDRGDPCGRFYPGCKEAPQASERVCEGMASREREWQRPHEAVRPDHGDRNGASRGIGETREGGGAPGMRRLVQPAAALWAHGCRAGTTPRRLTLVRSTACRAAGLGTGLGRGPHPHDDVHRDTPGRPVAPARGRGRAPGRRVLAGGALPHQQSARRERDGTAGMEHAAVADFHQAFGPDVREEAAEQLHDVELGSAEAGPAHVPGGAGDGTVQEAHEAAVGEGHLADGGSAGGAGGVAVVLCLTVAMPGDRPPLGSAVLQQSGVRHGFCAERTGDGGERVDRHQDVGASGPPSRAVLGEAPTGHHGMEGRVVLEWPAPRRQDPGATRQGRPHAARVLGPPLAGRGRGLTQGVGREALLRAEAGAERLRDRQGEEDVRPRELCVEVGLQPLRRCMRLALGAVAVATRRLDAVWSRTVWARREAMALGAAAAVVDGADPLTVCGGEGRRALQGCGRTGGADIPQGGHGRRSCMRGLRRSEASACPWWVRGRESIGVASWGCPRERCLSRGGTPASSRWGA